MTNLFRGVGFYEEDKKLKGENKMLTVYILQLHHAPSLLC